MTTWWLRPRELAHLLNPAFGAVLLHTAVQQYEKVAGRGMSYPLTMLILPIALHRPTRELLPSRASAKLHTWIQGNPSVLVGFAERARALRKSTSEAHLWGLRGEILGMSEGARVRASVTRLRLPEWDPQVETQQCIGAAAFIGKWFARSDDFMIFAHWGVTV